MSEIFGAQKQPVRFVSQHTPRFSEIDLYGHLNTKHYFDYLSENRMTGHREMLGLTLERFAKLPFAVVTKKCEIEFIRPILPEQNFFIESWVQSVTESSALISAVFSKEARDKVFAKAELVLVCLEKQTMRPQAWEEDFLQKFFH